MQGEQSSHNGQGNGQAATAEEKVALLSSCCTNVMFQHVITELGRPNGSVKWTGRHPYEIVVKDKDAFERSWNTNGKNAKFAQMARIIKGFEKNMLSTCEGGRIPLIQRAMDAGPCAYRFFIGHNGEGLPNIHHLQEPPIPVEGADAVVRRKHDSHAKAVHPYRKADAVVNVGRAPACNQAVATIPNQFPNGQKMATGYAPYQLNQQMNAFYRQSSDDVLQNPPNLSLPSNIPQYENHVQFDHQQQQQQQQHNQDHNQQQQQQQQQYLQQYLFHQPLQFLNLQNSHQLLQGQQQILQQHQYQQQQYMGTSNALSSTPSSSVSSPTTSLPPEDQAFFNEFFVPMPDTSPF